LLCADCPPISRPDLECHYRDNHDETLGNIEGFLDKSRLERIDASCCPLCTEYGDKYQQINQSSKCDVSIKQFQRHRGDPMEQLALAALPPTDTEDDEEERAPTFQEVLSNIAPPPWTLNAFMAYLSQNHCLETLEFTIDAERYIKHYQDMIQRDPHTPVSPQTPECEYVRVSWQQLLEAYIEPNGPREVNLPREVREHLLSLPCTDTPPDAAELEPAVKQIYKLMEESVLVPFLNSVHPPEPTDHFYTRRI
jgi:hypothetical protein